MRKHDKSGSQISHSSIPSISMFSSRSAPLLSCVTDLRESFNRLLLLGIISDTDSKGDRSRFDVGTRNDARVLVLLLLLYEL